MGVWKKALIVVVFVLVIFSALLFSFVLITNESGGLYFVSYKYGHSWHVQKEELFTLSNEIEETLGTHPKILIVLSSKLEKTNDSAGFGEDAPCFYSKWRVWNGWNILTIYLNEDEWKKVSFEKRNKLLGYFVVSQINRRLVISESNFTPSELFLSI